MFTPYLPLHLQSWKLTAVGQLFHYCRDSHGGGSQNTDAELDSIVEIYPKNDGLYLIQIHVNNGVIGG